MPKKKSHSTISLNNTKVIFTILAFALFYKEKMRMNTDVAVISYKLQFQNDRRLSLPICLQHLSI